MNRSVIIVAGGKGLRMGKEIPKQFLLVAGRPILMYTLEAFNNADSSICIVLVLPRDQQQYWKSLCLKYHFTVPHRVTDGGDTRFQSVKNGLALLPADGIIGVHDGVRPFVSKAVIIRCYEEACLHKAVVPVIGMTESVREISGGKSIAVRRDNYRLVQTPQVFDASLLLHSYEQPFKPEFTDDASVVESAGGDIYLTEGNKENIKITTPFDLIIANALLKCPM